MGSSRIRRRSSSTWGGQPSQPSQKGRPTCDSVVCSVQKSSATSAGNEPRLPSPPLLLRRCSGRLWLFGSSRRSSLLQCALRRCPLPRAPSLGPCFWASCSGPLASRPTPGPMIAVMLLKMLSLSQGHRYRRPAELCGLTWPQGTRKITTRNGGGPSALPLLSSMSLLPLRLSVTSATARWARRATVSTTRIWQRTSLLSLRSLMSWKALLALARILTTRSARTRTSIMSMLFSTTSAMTRSASTGTTSTTRTSFWPLLRMPRLMSWLVSATSVTTRSSTLVATSTVTTRLGPSVPMPVSSMSWALASRPATRPGSAGSDLGGSCRSSNRGSSSTSSCSSHISSSRSSMSLGGSGTLLRIPSPRIRWCGSGEPAKTSASSRLASR
mmetsp:Transcript_54690/g.138091  ORF Transcript_54690/g.138091 Transcript_54690/m.138091 type:complete len:385 (-) Transcript_54690:284-1438(-)